MKTLKSALCGLTLMMTFVINPAYLTGCVEEPTGFEYTQADMESTLTSALKSYTVSTDAGVYTVELIDVQAMARVSPSMISSAHACSAERLFVRGAAACSPFLGTQMNFEGRLSITWTPIDGVPVVLVGDAQAFEALYSVAGGKLDNGIINISVEGASVMLESQDGRAFEVSNLFAGPEHEYNEPQTSI